MIGYWLFIKKGLLFDRYTYKFNGRYIGQDRVLSKLSQYGLAANYMMIRSGKTYKSYGCGSTYSGYGIPNLKEE